MIGKAVVEALQKFVPEENIHLQEPMAGHTTFRIGGPADCFLELENEEQLKKVRTPVILVINKVDTVKKEELPACG